MYCVYTTHLHIPGTYAEQFLDGHVSNTWCQYFVPLAYVSINWTITTRIFRIQQSVHLKEI